MFLEHNYGRNCADLQHPERPLIVKFSAYKFSSSSFYQTTEKFHNYDVNSTRELTDQRKKDKIFPQLGKHILEQSEVIANNIYWSPRIIIQCCIEIKACFQTICSWIEVGKISNANLVDLNNPLYNSHNKKLSDPIWKGSKGLMFVNKKK